MTPARPPGGCLARWRIVATAGLLAASGLSCGGAGGDGSTTRPPPGGHGPGVSEIMAPADHLIQAGQTVYVPAYSHVDTADNRQALNLAVTLFVRNTDPGRPIVVTRVRYFDSGGKSLREFVARPLEVGPMASASFFVAESDVSGGASPSFLVDWVATGSPSDPVVESVMIGTAGTQGISFTGPGRVIASRKPSP